MNVNAIVGIPPVSYNHPIWYRDYRIHPGDIVFTPWVFSHRDYDGPEDRRCGYGGSVQDCRDQIDELEDE